MFIKFEHNRAVSYSPVKTEGYEVVEGFGIDDAYHLRKDESGAVYIDESAKERFSARVKMLQEISELAAWFDTFYRPQTEQAQRAGRTGAKWEAHDGVNAYRTQKELDAEADRKQARIRALRSEAEQ